MLPGQSFVVVDAFTDRPFAGNPAAVCVMESAPDEAWMKAVAREMNLSETAFLYPEAAGESSGASAASDAASWRLRWLTPQVEVALCGHATLATAHVLWESGRLARDRQAQFSTRSGPLSARRVEAGIALDFPAQTVKACQPPPGLLEALGSSALFVGKNASDYLVELSSPAAIRDLRPDQGLLAGVDARGVMVTAAADRPGVDFVSRFFAPRVGIPEDPVTGSAHCALGPFWGARLGKSQVVGYQASARGGTVHVHLRGDRLDLIGQAVTISEGQIRSSL